MCKILVIPKITDATRKNALKFMEKMKPIMSSSDKDGLGYAAVDASGALFGERWHTNAASYVKKAEDKVAAVVGDLYETRYYIPTDGGVNSFGTVNLAGITALTMHTRMATSGRTFENTHPFVYEDHDTSLIHNGVITNTNEFKFKVSSCDSESILISYVNANVNAGLSNIQEMAEKLVGYYACGVFSRTPEGARILDVFKGNTASLYMTYVEELDSYVYSTSQEYVSSACSSLGFKYSDVYSLKEGVAMRFNAAGEMIEKTSFKPRERWSYSGSNHSYNYGGNTTTNTGGGTVIDVSNKGNASGPKFINKNKEKKGKSSLTNEEILFMQLPPGIKRLNNYTLKTE